MLLYNINILYSNDIKIIFSIIDGCKVLYKEALIYNFILTDRELFFSKLEDLVIDFYKIIDRLKKQKVQKAFDVL